jgi:DNA-binding winged helix-turn-helix (wHTH) protein
MSGVIVPTPDDPRAEPEIFEAEASYQLDLASSTLWRGSVPLPLRAKTLEVLRLLVSRSGQVVSSGDLRDLVWGRKHGNEHGPKQCIRELRVLFEDAAEKPRFIETVGRMGYRFIGPVTLAKPLGGVSNREATHGQLTCFVWAANVNSPNSPKD